MFISSVAIDYSFWGNLRSRDQINANQIVDTFPASLPRRAHRLNGILDTGDTEQTTMNRKIESQTWRLHKSDQPIG